MDSKNIINGLGLYFYRVAENSQDIFWIRSADFESVLYVNPAFEERWQQPRDTIYSNPDIWLTLITPKDHNKVKTAWNDYIQTPHIDDTHSLCYQIRTSDNSFSKATDSCYPLFHEGRCIAFVGVTTVSQPVSPRAQPATSPTPKAITQAKINYADGTSYRQQTESSIAAHRPRNSLTLTEAHSTWSGSTAWQGTDHQSQNHFLDMMSHELRTPLNAVLGMAQILQQSPLTPEQSDQLDVIIQSGKNLLNSLSSMLDFAQLESNRVSLNLRPTAIRPLLNTCLSESQKTANNPSIDFQFSDDSRIPNSLITDPKRLKQITNHLLENAAAHTTKGHVSLKIALAEKKGETYLVTIEVVDSGSGIPAHKLHHIFKRFSQSGSGYQRQHHGIGLGLTVVKELITKMGGTISVTSTVGRGSRFSCAIPFAIDPSFSEGNNAGQGTKSNPMALNVLVVEDNPINQKITQRLLEQAGCQVNIAECGRAAVSSANDKHDLILMDIGLPDFDGFEATTRIRETQRVHRDVPIIAMTAHVFDQDKERCFQVGMNEVIAKPILREELLDLLQRWSPASKRSTIRTSTVETSNLPA